MADCPNCGQENYGSEPGPLEEKIVHLEARLKGGTCEVCFTSSWEPVPVTPESPHGIHCGYCYLSERLKTMSYDLGWVTWAHGVDECGTPLYKEGYNIHLEEIEKEAKQDE